MVKLKHHLVIDTADFANATESFDGPEPERLPVLSNGRQVANRVLGSVSTMRLYELRFVLLVVGSIVRPYVLAVLVSPLLVVAALT